MSAEAAADQDRTGRPGGRRGLSRFREPAADPPTPTPPFALSRLIRRAPIKVTEGPGGRISYRDDTLGSFHLVRQPGFASNEYQIKDLTTRVYWREADGAYFTAAQGGSRFDVQDFLKHRNFGAWLEGYRAATEFAQGTKNDPGRRRERIALDMHVLQQFFTNALFSPTEIERFDYQASPLNFQDEHTYIRAFATAVADVLRSRLTQGWGTDWRDRVYLGNDEPALHAAVRMSFTTIDITIDDLNDKAALRAKVTQLGTKIAEYVFARSAAKKTFEQLKKQEMGKVETELKTARKDAAQPWPEPPDKPTDEERTLIAALRREQSLLTLFGKLDSEQSAQRKLDDQIRTLADQIKTMESELKQQQQPTALTSGATGGPTPPTTDVAQKKLIGMQGNLRTKGTERAAKETSINETRQSIVTMAKELGVPEILAAPRAARNGLLDRNRARIIESLGEAAAQTSTYVRAVIKLSGVRTRVDALEQERGRIERELKGFVLLRNYPGGPAFADLTQIFRGLPPEKVRAFFDPKEPDNAGVKLATALREAVTLGAVERYVGQTFSALGDRDRKALTDEILDFLNNNLGAKPGPHLTGQAVNRRQSVPDLLQPLTDILGEITKDSTKTTTGLDKMLVSGGVLTLDSGKDGHRQPALLISDDVLKETIKSIIGKSGLVPTPTDAARKLLTHDVPLTEIVNQILRIQHDRDKNQVPTRDRLDVILAKIEEIRNGTFTGVEAAKQNLADTRKAFAEFEALAKSEIDHVRLLAPPVARMIQCLRILEGQPPEQKEAPGGLSPFALAQLQQNLDSAVADQHDIVRFTRHIQNLHEMIIHALELGMTPAQPTTGLPVPKDAQQVHLTHYGLSALTQTYNAVLAQHTKSRSGTDPGVLSVTAFNDIYFEMMERLTRSSRRAPDTPTNVNSFLANFAGPGLTIAQPKVDLIVIDIHPNDASQIAIHRQDVIRLIAGLFKFTPKDFRCTILVDITLNHVADQEVAAIRKEAQPHISSGQLNLVFMQSLTKFAQLGSDKHSGGLMFHFNNPEKWAEFNEYVAEATNRSTVDPTIKSYFDLLFEVTRDEQIKYIEKVRRNTRWVYNEMREAFANLGVERQVLELAENDDDKTCYVAFHYKPFAAAVFQADASGTMIKELAHDVLFSTIDKLSAKLNLPLNMRTSFGFPISNLGDIGPGIRLTVGIEDQKLLARYVQLLTFVNGRISKEMSKQGAQRLSDPSARKTFLAEIVDEVKDLDDLEKRFRAAQADKQKAPANWQPVRPVSTAPEPVATTAPTGPQTVSKPDDPSVGIGRVEHIWNSCYAATVLNFFATTPAYRKLLEAREPTVLSSTPSVPSTKPEKAEVEEVVEPKGKKSPSVGEIEIKHGERLRESNLGELADNLRKQKGVTGDQMKGLLRLFDELGIIAPPYYGQEASIHDQQDASEILQSLLSKLDPGQDLQFQDTRTTKVKDTDKETESTTKAEHPVLHLDINDSTSSIAEAIRLYCAPVAVNKDTTTRLTFSRLPTVLTVALKRFELLHGVWPVKLPKEVDAPESFTFPEDCLAEGVKVKATYRLTSIGHHEGIGPHSGHYTAYVRNSENEWVLNDDIGGRSRPSKDEMDRARRTGYLYIYQRV